MVGAVNTWIHESHGGGSVLDLRMPGYFTLFLAFVVVGTRDRIHDLSLASQVLTSLSYSPILFTSFLITL